MWRYLSILLHHPSGGFKLFDMTLFHITDIACTSSRKLMFINLYPTVRFSGLLLLVFGLAFPVLGQNTRTTEEEVNTQKIFIDANREKILGNYEDAAYLYKEVLKRDKENDAAAYELARVYDALDKDDKALNSIKLALAIEKENNWYKMFLADVYEKKQEFKKAAEIYEALAKEDPKHADYYFSKQAFYLIKANNPEKAITVYNQLEQEIGISEDVIRKKQSLYLGIGKEREAAGELKKLITAFPSIIEYHHVLAEFYTSTGKSSEANEIYRQILEIDSEDAKATIQLAAANGEKQEGTTYLASLKPIFQKSDADIDLKVKELIPYISQVAKTKDLSLANACIELTQILEEVHPKEAKTYSAYGDLLYHSGRKKEALPKYERAVELDNTVFPIWEQIMYIYTEEYNIEGLLSASEKVIDLFPNQAKSYYFNGLANNELGNFSEAINMYQQAMMMSRRNPVMQSDLLRRMGAAYFQLKKYDRSDKAFESALQLNPKDYMALNDYSYYLASRGEKLEKAKEMITAANQLQSNKVVLQDTYGWVLYKMKDFDGAKEWFGKAMTNGGNQMPQILEHYGDALFQLNDIDGATQHWQMAMDKGAQSELLEKKIADRRLYE